MGDVIERERIGIDGKGNRKRNLTSLSGEESELDLQSGGGLEMNPLQVYSATLLRDVDTTNRTPNFLLDLILSFWRRDDFP